MCRCVVGGVDDGDAVEREDVRRAGGFVAPRVESDGRRDAAGRRGRRWITEAGGIVNSKAFRNRTEAQAQAGTQRLINDVVDLSTRITRLYYYALVGDEPGHNGNPAAFDSGLLHYADATHAAPYPRPMYDDYLAKTNPGNVP
ncbi:MAG: hypothetical protein QOH30_949 [Baekduia sp.]|nr:hypothetical protein [Mycobacterium sp.]MDX6714391.1 hypothetical protein [Baekduia sp.]